MMMRKILLGFPSYSANASAVRLSGYVVVINPATSIFPDATSSIEALMSAGVNARDPIMLISLKYSGNVLTPWIGS